MAFLIPRGYGEEVARAGPSSSAGEEAAWAFVLWVWR